MEMGTITSAGSLALNVGNLIFIDVETGSQNQYPLV